MTEDRCTDRNTGKVISGSCAIAGCLDTTYPSGIRTLFPKGPKFLFAALEADLLGTVRPIILLQLAPTCPLLNESSGKYYRSSREALFGVKIEEISPVREMRDTDLEKAKTGLTAAEGWLAKTSGEYVMDDTMSYADAILEGWNLWIKQVTHGADSAVRKDIATWHGGRWGIRVANIEELVSVA
ncbi:hypothetical protein BV22DRAFT_286875 [Leucogyrophana mollusca]|uniref:Uncharacterized protein n=1 Tax=Leucogyrophana mollusca TaxID=85980 RepID=A0ACB8BQ85_9AGAM|nr:hypothetical protein BV22DRAFT_286875 [Leucogyrophana mollusca]